MRFLLTRSLLLAFSILGLATSPVHAWDKKSLELNMVRFYLPDDEMGQRLGSDVKAFADYIRALQSAAATYLEKSSEPKANGLLIAVGVKPGRHSRVWCEAVEGNMPTGQLGDLEKILTEVPAVEAQAPVAFALEIRLGGHKVTKFPVFPAQWSNAQKSSKQPLMIPDELFKVIWPD